MSINDSAERLVYRVAGLPVALGVLIGAYGSSSDDPLRHAFAERYWGPHGAGEWAELATAIALSPFALLLASAWFTTRNGSIIRERYGRSIAKQLADQLKLYFSAGILPPWYYIFSLHDDGERRASSFIERFETKTCYFRLLKHKGGDSAPGQGPLRGLLRSARRPHRRNADAAEWERARPKPPQSPPLRETNAGERRKKSTALGLCRAIDLRKSSGRAAKQRRPAGAARRTIPKAAPHHPAANAPTS